MSELTKNNAISGFNKPSLPHEEGWEDFENDVFGEEGSVEGVDSEEPGWEGGDVTLDQIAGLKNKVRELERKFSAQENLAGKDGDLLKMLADLQEAERHEKFSGDEEHQRLSAEKFEEAQRFYAKALSALKSDKKTSSEGNSESDEEGSGRKPLNPDFLDKDSAPRTIDEKAKSALYDLHKDVTIHTRLDDEINTHEITATGYVTLFGATQKASFQVAFDEKAGQYVVRVTDEDSKGKPGEETYRVSAQKVEKIILDSKQVDTSSLTKEQLEKIQIGLSGKKAKQNLPVEWPKGRMEDFVPNSDWADEARKLVRRIESAGRGSGNWSEVSDYFNSRTGDSGASGWLIKTSEGIHGIQDQELLNDVVRKTATAIYRASGATEKDDPRFQKLLQKIPLEIRYTMINWVTKEGSELREKQGGDQWNSQETAGVIQASIDAEREVKGVSTDGVELEEDLAPRDSGNTPDDKAKTA